MTVLCRDPLDAAVAERPQSFSDRAADATVVARRAGGQTQRAGVFGPLRLNDLLILS
jgi:hypothetical protein